jgi:hypothetical protein
VSLNRVVDLTHQGGALGERGDGLAIYCPQRTDTAPARLDEFTADYSVEGIALRRGLGIGDGWASLKNTPLGLA